MTSANWSVAAWGAGKIAPHNFELGVLLEFEWTEFEALGEPFDPPVTAPFCVDCTDEKDSESPLEWAEASWDGKRILLRARSSNLDTPITALVTFTGSSLEGISLVDGAAVMPWKDPEHTPLTARFTQGTEMLAVDVLDLRRPTEFAETPLPEVDPAVALGLCVRLSCFSATGGLVVDPETIPGLGGADRPPAVGAPVADYRFRHGSTRVRRSTWSTSGDVRLRRLWRGDPCSHRACTLGRSKSFCIFSTRAASAPPLDLWPRSSRAGLDQDQA